MNQLQHLIQQSELANLSLLLQQSLKGINTQQTYNTFKNLQTKSQSYLYFLALLISPHFEESIRQLAGINLKNMLKRNIESLSSDTLTLIKRVLFQQYDSQTGRVLKVIGLIMGAIIQKIKFQKETLQFLLEKANQGNVFAIESLKRVVEDFRFDSQNMNMIQSQQFAELSKQLVTILIPQCQTENKQYAIQCFNVMIYPMPISLVSSLKRFVQILKYQLSTNQNNNVLKAVMEGFEAIVSTRKDLIDQEIIQLVAEKTFSDSKIAKVEVNFWIEALDSDSVELLKPVLKFILPKFIMGLILTNEDISNIMETASKCYLQDSQQGDTKDMEQDEELGEDQEDEGIAKGGDYTLRKRCGMIIGKLSFEFSDELWGLTNQYIAGLLITNDWLKQQLAVLYIGLISQNCQQILKVHITELMGLINNIMINAGQHHLLKSTCLWALSQNTSSLVEVASTQQGTLNNYINMILSGMKDQHNNVRQASCNSLSNLIQVINQKIFPWFNSICEIATPALFVYKGNSLSLLLQLFDTLAQQIKKQNYNKKILDKLLVPLCQKWNNIPKQSDDNCQIIQCLVSVCQMGREYLGEYTIQLYDNVIQHFDPKSQHIFCRAADFMETLIKETSIQQQQHIHKSGLIEKTIELVMNTESQVKQACYSLLSTIIEYIGIPHPEQTMGYIYSSLNKTKEAQINNCLFCMLQIIVKYPDLKMTQYINQMLNVASERLLVSKLQAHFKINYSKVIGTLAFYHPEIASNYLKKIFIIFCLAMKASNEHTKKYHIAVAGLLKLIKLKGQQIFQDFKYLADLGICMKNPPVQNKTFFKEILKFYQNTVGVEGWNQFLGDPFFLPAAVHKIQNLVNS